MNNYKWIVALERPALERPISKDKQWVKNGFRRVVARFVHRCI